MLGGTNNTNLDIKGTLKIMEYRHRAFTNMHTPIFSFIFCANIFVIMYCILILTSYSSIIFSITVCSITVFIILTTLIFSKSLKNRKIVLQLKNKFTEVVTVIILIINLLINGLVFYKAVTYGMVFCTANIMGDMIFMIIALSLTFSRD